MLKELGIGVVALGGVVIPAVDSAAQSMDLTPLLQYGPLGVFTIIFVVFARTSYKRETDRADRMEAEVTRLNQVIQDRHIPALESATNALKDSTDLMRELRFEERFKQRDRGDRE